MTIANDLFQRPLALSAALLCALGLGFAPLAAANEGETEPEVTVEVEAQPEAPTEVETQPETPTEVAATDGEDASIAFVRAQPPEGDVKSVWQLREAGFKPGDRVTVRAQIGGRNPPWLNGMAMMLLADAKELAACTTGGCGSPWDFCSAPQDKLLLHTGIVRWLDENGEPRPISFHEVADIAPLSTVIITGVVADVGDPQALVIDADSFHLEERGPFAALMDQMKEEGTGPYTPR